MKKLFFLLSCLFAINTACSASDERNKMADYVVVGTDFIKQSPEEGGIGTRRIWHSLFNPRQRDHLYEPLNILQVFSHQSTGCTASFSRTTKLGDQLNDMVETEGVRTVIANILGPDNDDDGFGRVENDRADSVKNYLDAMTFQEHRLGVHLSKEWRSGQWYAAMRSWFGMAERNYWLDKEARDNIGGLMKQSFPGMDGKMKVSDFLAMNWGFGDTHVKVGYTLPLAKKWEVTAGLRGVIPTARSYVRPTKNHQIPLESNVFTGFLRKRLNELLIEPRLGNGKHFGTGAWIEAVWNKIKSYETNKLSTVLYAGFDYLHPATEERFLLHKETAWAEAGLSALFKTDDAQFRSFLSQYIVPEPVSIVVCPGVVAQAGFIANMRFEKVSMFAGYDYYYKNAEDFDRFIFKNKEEQFLLRQKDFGSTSDGAQLTNSQHQHKIQLGMAHSSTYRNVKLFEYLFRRIDATFSLHGAFSVGSKEMGDDFVIALSAGWRL